MADKITRRRFVRDSAAAAAVLTLGLNTGKKGLPKHIWPKPTVRKTNYWLKVANTVRPLKSAWMKIGRNKEPLFSYA